MTENQNPNPGQQMSPDDFFSKLNTVMDEKFAAFNQAPTRPASTAGASGNNSDLMAAIDAMPEKIISGLREAFPSGNTGVSGNEQSSGQQESQEQNNEPGKKSFTEWWFGGGA